MYDLLGWKRVGLCGVATPMQKSMHSAHGYFGLYIHLHKFVIQLNFFNVYISKIKTLYSMQLKF